MRLQRQLIVTTTFRATLREQVEDHGRPSHEQIHKYISALFFHFYTLPRQHIFRSGALCSSLASEVALAHCWLAGLSFFPGVWQAGEARSNRCHPYYQTGHGRRTLKGSFILWRERSPWMMRLTPLWKAFVGGRGGGKVSIASRILCGKYIILMDLKPRTLDKC